ncbi:MAG: hypothetical protein AB8G96_00295 [Phycisphaerales bacterium]
MDEFVDRVARLAGRMLVTGEASNEADAVRMAARDLGLEGVRASPSLVRRHAEALDMQARGAEAHQESVVERWRAIEELMSFLEGHLTGDSTLLIGRAARGHFEGTTGGAGSGAAPVRIRLYTEWAVGRLAEALEQEAEVPEARVRTVKGRRRIHDAISMDDAGGEVLIVLMRPDEWSTRDRDIVRDEPIDVVDLEGLRRRIAAESADSED